MKLLHVLLALLLCAPLASPSDDAAAAVSAFVANPTSLRELLEAGQYDRLESTLLAIERGTTGRYDRENVWWAAFNYLAQPRPENDKRYDEWLTHAKGSPRARLARAMFLEKRGWRARGEKWAQQTGRSQFIRMADFHAEAKREYTALVEKSPDNLLAYDGLMSICLAEGGVDCSARWLRQALSHDPGSFNIRAAHMYALKPRWGGSYEAMAAFATEAQTASTRNPRLRHLLGFVDADRAYVAGLEGNWPESITLHTEALKYGPEPTFLANRALAYLSDGRPQKASLDIQNARDLSPVGWFYSDMRLAHTFALEGAIAYREGRKDAARKLIGRASEIEVDDTYILGWAAILQR